MFFNDNLSVTLRNKKNVSFPISLCNASKMSAMPVSTPPANCGWLLPLKLIFLFDSSKSCAKAKTKRKLRLLTVRASGQQSIMGSLCFSLLLSLCLTLPHISRAEIALTDGRLMGVTRELNSTATEDEALRRTLNQLEAELREVNATVAHKQQLLEDYLTSGFSGIGLKSSFF